MVFQGMVLFPLSTKDRREHLELLFIKQDVTKIRILENLFLSIPFLICIAILNPLAVLGAVMMILVLGYVKTHRVSGRTIPTPFKSFPVLLPSGFRRKLIWHVCILIFAVVAIVIGNYNLGLFTIIISWLLQYAYYGKIEPVEYVWMHKLSPQQFLLKQIREGILASLLLIFPFVMLFIVVDPALWYFPVLFYTWGLLGLTMTLLAKYGDFPDETSTPNGIMAVLSVLLAPLMLFTIPFFFRLSKNNLTNILHDRIKEHH